MQRELIPFKTLRISRISRVSYIGLLLLLLAGCAARPLQLDPLAASGVQVSYDNGTAQLRSRQVNDVDMTLLDTNSQTMLFKIAVTNGTDKSFHLSPSNVRLVLSSTNNVERAGKVYTRSELGGNPNNYDFAWDSAATVANAILPAVMPRGGLAGSLVNQLVDLGMQQARERTSRSAEPEMDTALVETYMRRHTLAPGESYEGVIKVKLPRAPAPGDSLQVVLTTPVDSHVFQFTIPTA